MTRQTHVPPLHVAIMKGGMSNRQIAERFGLTTRYVASTRRALGVPVESKATCLWLKRLPKLVPTNIVDGREQRVFRMPPSPDRWKERSRTFEGIAEAMADQWSADLPAVGTQQVLFA